MKANKIVAKVKRAGFALIALAALSGACPTVRAEETPVAVNPALEKFGATITFYASFDKAVTADLSNGNGTQRGPKIEAEYKPGVYGSAFLAGGQDVAYDAAGNIDLSKPGAVAMWLSAFEWKRDLPETPYIFFLRILDHGRNVMLARMGMKANKETVYAYAQAGNDKKTLSAGNTQKWEDAQWHLLVVNWRSDALEFSYDGRVMVRGNVPDFGKVGGKPGLLIVGNKGDTNQRYLVDEVMVFDRLLEQDEINWLWESKPLEGNS